MGNVSAASSPTAASSTAATGLLGTPQQTMSPGIAGYQEAQPSLVPQAWGFADVPSTQDQVFTGDAAPPKFLTTNQKLALVADKLHIKPHAGTALIEQIRAKLAAAPKAFRTDQAGNEGFYVGPAGGIVSSKKIPQIPENLQGANATGVNLDSLANQLMNYVGAKPPPGKPTYQQAGKLATQIAFSMTPTQLSQLQTEMYKAGFYDQSVLDGTYSFTPGHADQWTTQAIGHMLSYTAALNKQPQGAGMTWADALNEAVQNPGGVDGLIGEQKAATSVGQATAAQLASTLQTKFEAQLGRMPTAADLQQFTGDFDAAELAAKGKEAPPLTASGGVNPDATPTGATDLATGIPMLPGMPTAAEAAVPFAQSSNPVEFMGHQLSNAYALFLNSIIGNSSQKALPGYNPNETTAASSV